MARLKQFLLLLWKNFKLQIRHPWVTLFEFGVPTIFCLILVFVRTIVKYGYISDPTIYEPFSINALPKYLFGFNTPKVLYAPDPTHIQAVMNKASESLGISVKGFSSEEQMLHFYLNTSNQASILAGVVFDYEQSKEKAFTGRISYKVRPKGLPNLKTRNNMIQTWHTREMFPLFQALGPREKNSSWGGAPGYMSQGFLPLQHAVAMGIIQTIEGNTLSEDLFVLEMLRYPYPPYYDDQFILALQFFFPVILMLSFIYPSLNIVKNIVTEKEKKLKEAMKMMGLSNWMHWLAWYLKYFLFLVISVGIITALLSVKFEGNVAVLNHSDSSVIFVLLLVYTTTTICFCFFLSVFFSKANSAAAGAGIVFFLTFIPYFFIFPRFNELSLVEKLAASLLSNTALSISSTVLTMWEATGTGVQWNNLSISPSPDNPLTMSMIFVMLIVDAIIYLALTWYIEAVFPGEYGVPEPWYFPFKPTYWCRTSSVLNSVSQLFNSGGKLEYFEEEPTGLMPGIQIQSLTKVYDKRKPPAVNNISANMYRGHITVLLGHNGAGKSTAISMLTGLFPPTSGTASVNGFDICDDIDGVHMCLGICPQYDVLFDDLTVDEHLYFFCKLKGYIPDLVSFEIDRIVTAIGLDEKRSAKSKTLSGGMKRKLSVGIALIGGSQVVMLDEPTSGMDPSARRFIWDLLQLEKEDRTILLTTHFMEEADILGDRIAIMAEGEIQCCGSPMFLKKKYGAGYHLVLVKQPSCDVAFITSLIHSHLPTAEMASNVGAELSYILPHEGSNSFEKLFNEIERRKEELRISSYGASITTMEEVFIKVGQKISVEHSERDIALRSPSPLTDSGVNMVDEETVSTAGCKKNFPMEEDDHNLVKNTGMILFWQQLSALLLKRILYTARNWLLTLSQLFLPPLFLILTLLVVRSLPKPEDAPSLELNLNSFHGTNVPYSLKNYSSAVLGMSEIFVSQFDHGHDKPILVGENKNITDYLIKVGEQDIGHYNLHNIIAASFSYNIAINKTLLKSLFNNQAFHSPAIALFAMDTMLLKYFTSNGSYSLSVFNHPLPRTISEKGKQQETQATEAYQIAQDLMFGMSFLMSSFVIFLVKESTSKSKHLQRVSGVNLFTFWFATFLWDFVNYMIPCIFVLFVFKAFGTEGMSSSNEQGRLLLLFFIHGLSALPFIYCASFLFVMPSTAYVRMCLFNIVGGIACLLTVTIMEIPDLGVVEISRHLDWTFSIILPNYCLGRSVSNLFQNHQFNKLCSKYEDLCDLLYNSTYFDQIKPCCRGMCDNECIPWRKNYLSIENPGIGRQLIFLIIQALLFFGVLALCELKMFRYLRYKLNGRKILPVAHEATEVSSESVEDDDVFAERQKIQNLHLSELFHSNRLILKQLTKDYGSIIAVNKLSLGVRKGECFGLLGLNGAGKTTTFRMITGDEAITSGDVFLDGHSARTATRKVQLRLGYCPQFDALIDQLTGRETLKMFARLRGLQENVMSEQITKLSSMLTFDAHIDKLVKEYSGGNKRKLSTAIALLGNPPVIFLDEPTTGMDPVSRRNVWDVLLHVLNSGHSIVLTSHSMEECEALCNRLVIMVNGKLCCMGSPQHLKNKFGQGFTLIIKVQRLSLHASQRGASVEIRADSLTNVSDSSAIDMNCIFDMNETSILKRNVHQVKKFVEKTFAGCILKDIHEGFLHYHIPNPQLGWAEIFGSMEQARVELNIEDYSVGQTSLEQVFLNFARAQRFTEEL